MSTNQKATVDNAIKLGMLLSWMRCDCYQFATVAGKSGLGPRLGVDYPPSQGLRGWVLWRAGPSVGSPRNIYPGSLGSTGEQQANKLPRHLGPPSRIAQERKDGAVYGCWRCWLALFPVFLLSNNNQGLAL
jgi:hypothetical protein